MINVSLRNIGKAMPLAILVLFVIMMIGTSGCANLALTNSQKEAGITTVTAEPALAEKDKFTRFGDRVVYKSGKESSAINVVIDLDKDGQGNPAPVRVEITAGDVKAFEGQRISADAAVKTQEALGKTTSDVTGKVVEGAVKAFVPSP